MTSINMNSRHKPFLLKPVGKDYLWGGERLREVYGKQLPMHPLAETWECSTHPDGISTVGSGVHTGKLLTDVLKEHPEYLGTRLGERGELPVLVKWIDAKEKLSIQVHPDDCYAFEHENQQKGKTELWYVAEADKDASLIYGFLHDITEDQLAAGIKNGTIERYVQTIKVQKDEIFLIEAGTVHAIGAGIVLVEVQQTSDLTYRMYDYDRTDQSGNKRMLHIDKSLQVAKRTRSLPPRQPMRVLKYKKGCAAELVCRCPHFQVERTILNTEMARELLEFHTESNSFCIFVCLDGCGVIYMEEEGLNFFKGDCIFVPADSERLWMHGKAQFLKIT